MKRYRLLIGLAGVGLMLSLIACGGGSEPVIETAPSEMNLVAADIPGWTAMGEDMTLEDMPALDLPHVLDANMRGFGNEGATGMVLSIVFSTDTVDAARQEMEGEVANDLVENLQAEVPDASFESGDAPDIGDQTGLVWGKDPATGLNVYIITFRKANVVALLTVIGERDQVTEPVAVFYAQTLADKIE